MHAPAHQQADVKLRPQTRHLNILSKEVIKDVISGYRQEQNKILAPLQNLMSKFEKEALTPIKAEKGSLQARFNTPFNLQNIDEELKKVQEFLIKTINGTKKPKNKKMYIYQSGFNFKEVINLEGRLAKAQEAQQQMFKDKLFSVIKPQGKLYSHTQKLIESENLARKSVIDFLETSAKSTKNKELQTYIHNQINNISKESLTPNDIGLKVLDDYIKLQAKEADRVKSQFAIDENDIISKLQEPLLKLI